MYIYTAMYNGRSVCLPKVCWGPGDGIQPGPEALQSVGLHHMMWEIVPFPCCSGEEGVVEDITLNSRLSEFVSASGSAVPC